jgi:TonB family protein
MKDSILHALDIGALALWTGVTGLATVAMWAPSAPIQTTAPSAGVTTELGQDFLVGDTLEDSASEGTPAAAEEITPVSAAPLPAPPAMTPRTRRLPLPEIPNSPRSNRFTTPSNSLSVRLAAGHTPGPSYPAAARAAHQTGTVVMQFTVNAAGDVIAASVYSSSNFALLDQEAVRTVKTWTFPPGEVMSLIRPIVFELP